MTDTERKDLNERIARKCGYFYYNGSWWQSYGPNNRESERIEDYQLPDFTREWEHAGPLLEAMVQSGKEIVLDKCDGMYGCEYLFHNRQKVGETLQEAIARAFDAWEEPCDAND